MMLQLLLALALAAGATAQRPMYAGSGPIGRPDLASRFRDPAAETTPAPAPAAGDLNNRFGDTAGAAPLPVDALGDAALVDRLNQWPREHRPFWLINAGAIEAHRNRDVNRPQQPAAAGAPAGQGGGFQGGSQGGGGFAGGFQPGAQDASFDTRGSFDNLDPFNSFAGQQQQQQDRVPSLPIRPAPPKSPFISSSN